MTGPAVLIECRLNDLKENARNLHTPFQCKRHWCFTFEFPTFYSG